MSSAGKIVHRMEMMNSGQGDEERGCDERPCTAIMSWSMVANASGAKRDVMKITSVMV